MRASTSASHACGSTSLRRAVAMSVYMNAARSPPRSEPANSHDFLPRAMPLSARSAALFVRQIRPSSRNRVKADQSRSEEHPSELQSLMLFSYSFFFFLYILFFFFFFFFFLFFFFFFFFFFFLF